MKTNKLQLNIGWFYPRLMSTYGDRGNILTVQKRCEWREITTEIITIDQETTRQQLEKIDLIFGGGAQDREQEIVMKDLFKKKEVLVSLIEKYIPSLFVCGSPQLLGKYYEPVEEKRIEGLGIFDMITRHPKPNEERFIGNVIAKIETKNISGSQSLTISPYLVGFENHSGRTMLGKSAKPFAKILKGNGNNGQDHTEGIIHKNTIGTYLHGPLLPKNPELADWLIAKALEVKYKETIDLQTLDDSMEQKAKSVIAKRLGIRV